jgi:rRNA maturation RNase YbeY
LIQNHHPTSRLPFTHKSIHSLVVNVFKGEKCAISELFINFINNRDIKPINRKYLNHNYFTDVITFPYNMSKEGLEGEILVSLDKVRENAKIFGTGFSQELKRVIIHGCLHLAGYKDGTKHEAELIRNKENLYMDK